MSWDSIDTNILGHLKSGDKLAIVVQKQYFVKPLMGMMRARNVSVRVISNKDYTDDFFFLLSAQRELIGRGESTFFQWATLLNRKVQHAKVYFFHNGMDYKSRFIPEEFPPVIENSELQKRLKFELYKL